MHQLDPIRQHLQLLPAPPLAARAAVAAAALAGSGSDVGAPLLDPSGRLPIIGGPIQTSVKYDYTGSFFFFFLKESTEHFGRKAYLL